MRINWPDLGYAATAVLAVVAVIPPLRKTVGKMARNRYRDWRFMRGSTRVAGLNDGQPPARERVETLERTTITKADHEVLVGKVNALDRGQLEMLRRLETLKPNGGDTMETGDLILRIARELGVADPKSARSRRRRAEDPPERA